MIFIQDFFRLGMKREIPPLWDTSMLNGTRLNLGAGNHTIMGALPLDYPEWNADRDEIPFDADSVVEIHAYHFLEHCVDPVRVLRECQRVMRKGAVMNIVVPYYKSEMAHHDLDHKHFFTEDTFKVLFNTPYYNKHRIEWRLSVHCCFIMGIVERNLALFVQLVKA